MAYRDIVLNDGAAFFWPCTETTGTTCVDVVAGQNLTYTNSPVLASGGTVVGDGPVPTFVNASSQYATLTTNPALGLNTGYTAEVWCGLTSLAANQTIFSYTTTVSASSVFTIVVDTTGLVSVTFFYGSTSLNTNNGVKFAADGKPHHILITQDNSVNYQLILDGIGFGLPFAGAAHAGTTSTPLRIGAGGTLASPTLFANAHIGYAAIYKKILTVGDAQRHYYAGLREGIGTGWSPNMATHRRALR